MLLTGRVVVVTVDPRPRRATRDVGEPFEGGGHQLATVRHRVFLGPQHVGDVGAKGFRSLEEVGEVGILQGLVLVLGPTDVLVRQLVSHASGARMHDQPDHVALVHRDFDEVVARAECAELHQGPLLLL